MAEHGVNYQEKSKVEEQKGYSGQSTQGVKSPVQQKAAVKRAKVVPRSGLRLREGPTLHSRIILVAPHGAEVDIVSSEVKGHPGWVRVKTKSGVTGYMASQYLDMENAGSGAGGSKGNAATGSAESGVITARHGLRLREAPSINSKILGIMQHNSHVMVYSWHVKGHSGWAKVKSADGKSGYAVSRYISHSHGDGATNTRGAHKEGDDTGGTHESAPSKSSKDTPQHSQSTQDKDNEQAQKQEGKALSGMHPASAFTTSNEGVQLIAGFESFFPEPYNDPLGYATIGYGHLLHKSRVTAADRRKWGRLTKAQGMELLHRDLAKTEAAVKRLVKVPITQGMFDALVSFTFNVGSGNLSKSTLLRKLNRKDYKGASREFLRWNKGRNKHGKLIVLRGLTRRRHAESAMFCSKGCP